MKKTQLFLIAIMMSGWGFSQTISPEVLATSGEHFAGSEIQLNWTIGEAMIETYLIDQLQLSQGFHQSSLNVTSRGGNIGELKVKVYPNPVADVLLLEWPKTHQGFDFKLFNASGKLILEESSCRTALPESIDFSTLPAGSYFLYLYSRDRQHFNSFQIIKHKQ